MKVGDIVERTECSNILIKDNKYRVMKKSGGFSIMVEPVDIIAEKSALSEITERVFSLWYFKLVNTHQEYQVW